MENQNTRLEEMEDVIDLGQIARVLLGHWKRILLVMIFAGLIAYGGSTFLIEPSYCSSFTAYINNNTEQVSETVSATDITAARSLTTTYGAIITSRSAIEEAIEKGKVDCTYEELKSAVTVQAVEDTEIIRVDVVTKDAAASYDIARALQKVTPGQIKKIMEASSMSIIDSAKFPSEIYSPNYIKITLIAALAAGLLVCVILIVQDLMDDSIKSTEELEERYGIPVLGVIHDSSAEKKQRKGEYGYGKNA